jgi:hypothetical protein
VRGLPGSAELRRKLHQVNGFSEVEEIFCDYLSRGLHLEPREPVVLDEPELLAAEHA